MCMCQPEPMKPVDFLPFVCDFCSGVFCLEHRSTESHSCPEVPVKREFQTWGGSTSYPCSFQDCKGKELLPVICPQCEKHFCLSKAGLPVKGRRGAKNSATAARVALMKLKLHAAGDKGLPQRERTYFQVHLPKESKDSSQPLFFCSKWSLGKVVNYAASLASLKNNNNVLTAKVTVR
uniref:AN1-type zinc finger protein 1-like n=1 Tax=Centroberyx gerrardi TaxID=166262 RepID=UPI003AAAB2B4